MHPVWIQPTVDMKALTIGQASKTDDSDMIKIDKLN